MCRSARQDRENTCWEGGNTGHDTAKRIYKIKQMKILTSLGLFVLLISGQTNYAQSKVNEPCNTTACESGLYCIETRDGGKKCAACEQYKHDEFAKEVDKYCSGSGQLSLGELTSDAYKREISEDEILKIMDNAEKCYKSRLDVNEKCFNGGNKTHLDERYKMERVVNENRKYYDFKKGQDLIYNCSQNSYEGIRDRIKAKCDNLSRSPSDSWLCPDLEKLASNCKECVEQYENLRSSCFRGSYSPYREQERKSFEELMNTAKSILDKKKSDQKCN